MRRNKEESSRVRGEGEFGNHSCGSRCQAGSWGQLPGGAGGGFFRKGLRFKIPLETPVMLLPRPMLKSLLD